MHAVTCIARRLNHYTMNVYFDILFLNRYRNKSKKSQITWIQP